MYVQQGKLHILWKHIIKWSCRL